MFEGAQVVVALRSGPTDALELDGLREVAFRTLAAKKHATLQGGTSPHRRTHLASRRPAVPSSKKQLLAALAALARFRCRAVDAVGAAGDYRAGHPRCWGFSRRTS